MRKRLVVPLSLAAAGAIALPALAAVSFSTSTGEGFIGRGDVITYVGKSGLVTNPEIKYSEHSVTRYSQECYDTVGQQQLRVDRDQQVTLVRNVRNQVQYDTRKAKGNDNITGYLLSGFSQTAVIGDPAPTNLCAENGLSNETDEHGNALPVTSQVIQQSAGALTFQGVSIPF